MAMKIATNLNPPGDRTGQAPVGVKRTLIDGSKIAVIGAGPAGSMFSYFLLDIADTIGLDLHVDLYEPRRFCHRGPAGCNHCGGIVSESLVQKLATEGIRFPDDVVQRGLESYTLHMDVGDVEISTPIMEKRIAAMYRGNGPRDSEPLSTHSFDGYLLELAQKKGANVVHHLVMDVRRDGERMRVDCADAFGDDYDLVVVATGVNSRLVQMLAHDTQAFREPTRTQTFICEFRLGRDVIRDTLGPSMHVFLLDIPRLEFAALIPKGDYATLCLLGDDIDEELIDRFFDSPEVKNCFPGGRIPPHACHCYPRINIRPSKPAYADRLVMIGDAGATRLFKDGIGAAYRTAKAAAKTVIFHGVNADDFETHYAPLCGTIARDNQVGKVVFGFGSLVQKSRFARRGVLRMTENEQLQPESPKRMSAVLWDLFSGSASYTDVFLRTLHPAYIAGLFWNLVAGNVQKRQPRVEIAPGEGGDHVKH